MCNRSLPFFLFRSFVIFAIVAVWISLEGCILSHSFIRTIVVEYVSKAKKFRNIISNNFV